VDKGEEFERAIENPAVLECMEAVLGPDFKLSSLNVRSAERVRTNEEHYREPDLRVEGESSVTETAAPPL